MYMVKSITIDGSDIKRGVEAVDENNTLLSTLTNTKQRVVFIYGSAENLYLGSVKGFLVLTFRTPLLWKVRIAAYPVRTIPCL